MEIGGSEGGITVFSALKNGAQRRAVVGFYGATDDALIFAWTEVLRADAAAQIEMQNDANDAAPAPKSNGGAVQIVGK